MNSTFRGSSSSTVLGQCREDLPKEDGHRRFEEGRSRSIEKVYLNMKVHFEKRRG